MKKIHFLIILLFTINLAQAQAPTISSFSPLKGIPGRLVTINGTNFGTTNTANIVFFGKTHGIIVSANPTQIVVLTPVGATYGELQVLNTETHLYGTSRKYFTPIFSPKPAAIVPSNFLPKIDYNAFNKPTSVAVADMNSNFRSNIVVANDVVVGHNGLTEYYGFIFNNNAVTGQIDSTSLNFSTYIPASTRPQSVITGDFTQSGYLGYAFACYGSNSLSINSTIFSSYYYSVGYGPIDVIMSDLDGDGRLDIITANALSFGVSILLNTNTTGAQLSFAIAKNITTGFQPQAVAIGDIDGDGKPDIVIANANNDTTLGLAILRNLSTPGNIVFDTVVNFATGVNARDVAVADIDGDNKPDVIVANQKSNTISVFRNIGKTGSIIANCLAPKVDFTTGEKPKAIALGDLNGDGNVDIVVANSKSNTVSIFQNNAVSGTINSGSLTSISISVGNKSQPYDVSVCDIDGDGKPDIIVAEYGIASIAVIKNDPGGNNFNIIGQSLSERALQYVEANSKTSNSFNATIFPNPAKDYTVLKTNNLHGKISIKLLNYSGNTMWQEVNTTNLTTIPLNNLPAGLYFIQLNDIVSSTTLKLIKQ